MLWNQLMYPLVDVNKENTEPVNYGILCCFNFHIVVAVP